MIFREFQEHFRNHQLITTQQIKNAFPDYSGVQLSRWVDKDWLVRIRQGQYTLSFRIDNLDRELLANEIKNSYISLEYALNYYNFIPEIPQKITSMTTERSEIVTTPVGDFIYHRIKPRLFTGYKLIESQVINRKIKMAVATKALFDYVYINNFKKVEEFEEMRLNLAELREAFDKDSFCAWLREVSQVSRRKSLENLLAFIARHA